MNLFNKKQYINIPGVKNTIVIGEAGSGMIGCYVKPVLQSIDTSFIYLDIDGFLSEEYATSLKERGFATKTLDLVNMDRSCKYNPFLHCSNEQDIISMIRCLTANVYPREDDYFWKITEEKLLCAVALYVYTVNEHQPEKLTFTEMKEILELYREPSKEDPNKNELTQRFDLLSKIDPDNPALGFYLDALKCSERSLMSVVISLIAKLGDLATPEISNLMSKNELDADNIVRMKTAVFINLPVADLTNYPIATLFLSQIMKEISLKDNRMSKDVRFILNDIEKFHIPNLDMIISITKHLRFDILTQSIDNVRRVYGSSIEPIIDCCQAKIDFGTISVPDCEFFAARSNVDAGKLRTMKASDCFVIVQDKKPYFAKKTSTYTDSKKETTL